MGDSHGHSSGHGHGHSSGQMILASARTERVLRIITVAIAVLTVLGLVLLWPGDAGDPGDTGVGADPALLASPTVSARVTSVVAQPCSYDAASTCRLLTIGVTGGERAGEVFTLEQPTGSQGRVLAAGDDIDVIADPLPDGGVNYSFYDYQRSSPLLVLLVLFGAAIVALGRWRGIGALAGLAASLAVLVVFMLPSLLDGNSPVLVALVAASVIAFIALYLAHGINTQTTIALISTFAALLVTGVLSWIFVYAAKFTGYSDDGSQFLDALGLPIDPRGILLAGIVIGSLGVLDDVTVTQVSAVWELRSAQPDLTTEQLFTRALRIGRDHISSTVNTLFLAYAGASLPLLLLFTEAGQGIGDIATREVVAVEIVRSLVGSIGLVSAVPITTWLAATVLATRPDTTASARSTTGSRDTP